MSISGIGSSVSFTASPFRLRAKGLPRPSASVTNVEKTQQGTLERLTSKQCGTIFDNRDHG